MYESVQVERRGAVSEITLNRPEVFNRVDDVAHRELVQVFRSFEGDPDLRAVVLASTGKVFSAGGDFELMIDGNSSLRRRIAIAREGQALLAALLDVVVPIVVALNGDAVGLGATIALACDAVVSRPGVRISDPHVPIGLVAGDGGVLVWPEAAGILRAKRYLLTGDRLDAEDAYRFGLVTDLVEQADDVLPTARALADRIAGLPPIAVQGTKQSLNQVLKQRFQEAVPLSIVHEVISMGSHDLLEAISAFREKRSPEFEGS